MVVEVVVVRTDDVTRLAGFGLAVESQSGEYD